MMNDGEFINYHFKTYLTSCSTVSSEHKLMVASVNKTPEDEIDNDISFHFCN